MRVTSCFALASHALVLLAQAGKTGATSEYIAASASTHPARVRRVLAPLVRAGVIAASEGGGGGYLLARRAADISLADVFAFFDEGRLFPRHPKAPSARCPVGAGIIPALEELEDEVDGAARGMLARRTVAWLARRVAAHGS